MSDLVILSNDVNKTKLLRQYQTCKIKTKTTAYKTKTKTKITRPIKTKTKTTGSKQRHLAGLK